MANAGTLSEQSSIDFYDKIALNIANLNLFAPKIQKESTKSNNEES